MRAKRGNYSNMPLRSSYANRSKCRLIIGQRGLRRCGGANNEQYPQTFHSKPRLKAPIHNIAFSRSRIAKYSIRYVNEVGVVRGRSTRRCLRIAETVIAISAPGKMYFCLQHVFETSGSLERRVVDYCIWSVHGLSNNKPVGAQCSIFLVMT